MSRVPRPLPGQRLTALPLTPAEAFVLAQIDGTVSERDLVTVTGLSAQQVGAAIDRLVKLGAVTVTEGAVSQERAGAYRSVPESNRTGRRQTQPPPSNRFPENAGHSAVDTGSPSPPLDDPGELDELVELDAEKKRRILDLYHRLEDISYYELLGLHELADKKQVKSAYYAVAPEFHPDRYFRKNLGSYKAKIEALFARVTLAHDVLTDRERRAEYDEYLHQMLRNRAMSAMLEQAPRDMAAVAAAVEEAAAALDAEGPGRYGRIAPASTPRPPASTPGPVSSKAAPASGPVSSPDDVMRQRREALARKLTGGGQRRPAPGPAQAPARTEMSPEAAAEIAARAAEALQRRRETAVAEARRQQLGRHMDAGRAALDRSDFAAAANAYRIALALAPDDPQVQATCNQAMGLAAAALADGYWKQAAYEEGQGRWGDAALSYSKVCAGQPENFRAHERVAHALLLSEGNVRRAVEYARKAVEISPGTAELRITLARAYAAAGLEKSAQGELDRARVLAPGDAKIQALIAQVRTTPPKASKVS
jgi:curved DNA-binding protein CbpA